MRNNDNDAIHAFPALYSEAEQMNHLKSKNTNFIFLFGKQGVGKTAITASMIHYLSSECEEGTVERIGNLAGKKLGERIRHMIANGRFPDRTNVGSLTEVDCCFLSNKSGSEELWFTFLEMSGEDLKQVDVHNYDGRLPDNIDVFFRVDGLSLTFILVTAQDEARNDDSLMANFLDYLIDKSTKYRKSRVLLLVSKWDQAQAKTNVEDFIHDNMRQTFRKINQAANAYSHFTLGKIDENDGKAFIRTYDPESPERVFEWLYKTLTGKSLFGPFRRIRKFL